MSRKITTEEWRKRVIHSGKNLNLTKSIYVDNKTPIVVGCPIHGFVCVLPYFYKSQTNGCPKCCGKGKTTESWIAEMIVIHGSKLDYSKSIYKDAKSKIDIICQIHGLFTTTPDEHRFSKGCPKCVYAERALDFQISHDEWIRRSNIAHDYFYDYSASQYVASNQKVWIICPKHGPFHQRAGHHAAGHGCGVCSSRVSTNEIAWLDYSSIPIEFRNKTLWLPDGSKYYPDAIDFENKIVWEFWGDFWHGNPKLFLPDDLNKVAKITYGELYKKTCAKIDQYKKLEYTLIDIWENDWTLFCKKMKINPITCQPVKKYKPRKPTKDHNEIQHTTPTSPTS